MSKTYTLKDEVYLVLVKYFKGSITRLNKSDRNFSPCNVCDV